MNSSPTTAILNDLPTDEDRLDFAPYIETLAEILAAPATQTPLTVGIFGSWGSGKTSLMTMLRDRIETDSASEATGFPHRTVWLNAWKYHQEQALWRSLLLLLLDDLENLIAVSPPRPARGEISAQELLERLRNALYRDTSWIEKGQLRPDWGQAIMAGTGIAFNLILSGLGLGLVKEVVEEAQKTLGKGEPITQLSKLTQAFRREELTQVQTQLRSLEQFQLNFERLVDLLLGHQDEEPRRLVVFIDDLDRCLPEKAVQVLEAIKLFLDVPGCVFVLGLDAEAIEAAIRTQYKGEVGTREYLDKIIQLPFILPPIEEDTILKYVDSLAPLLPDSRCAAVFAQGLPPNPRKIKRTLNMYLLLTRLVEKRALVRDAISPIRLAKVVAIQHTHPDLYELLRLRPGYLSELERHLRAIEQQDLSSRPDNKIGALPEALVPFQGRASLQRLLCLYDDPDTRFDNLTPLEVRSYITLTRQSTPLEAPNVIAAHLPFEPETILIPQAPFPMGTSELQAKDMLKKFDWAQNIDFRLEQPESTIALSEYQIGRYPVTNAEYAVFVEATGYRLPNHWPHGKLPDEVADHPIVWITWQDAAAYLAWLTEKSGRPYRLPSEAEWEKAARGQDGRLWPWGSQWDPNKVNCRPKGPSKTTPVGQYAFADSPYGCGDMAGNVMEWCSSLWSRDPFKATFGYPYSTNDLLVRAFLGQI